MAGSGTRERDHGVVREVTVPEVVTLLRMWLEVSATIRLPEGVVAMPQGRKNSAAVVTDITLNAHPEARTWEWVEATRGFEKPRRSF